MHEEEDIVENEKQTARKREESREVLSRAHKRSDCHRFPISPGGRPSINGRRIASISSWLVWRRS
jgi:hypothetical protein